MSLMQWSEIIHGSNPGTGNMVSQPQSTPPPPAKTNPKTHEIVLQTCESVS